MPVVVSQRSTKQMSVSQGAIGPSGPAGPPGPAGGAQAPYTYTATEIGVYYNGQTEGAGAPAGWTALSAAAQAAANGTAIATWLAGSSGYSEILFLPFRYYFPPETIKLGYYRYLRGVSQVGTILECVGSGDWFVSQDDVLGGGDRAIRRMTLTGGGSAADGSDSNVTQVVRWGRETLDSNVGLLTLEDCTLKRATDSVIHAMSSIVIAKRCNVYNTRVGIWGESASESHADEISFAHCSEASMYMEGLGANLTGGVARGGRTQTNGGLWRIRNIVSSFGGDGVVWNGVANSTIESASVEGSGYYTGVGGAAGASYRCIKSTGIMGDKLRSNSGTIARFESKSINCHLGRISHANGQRVVNIGNNNSWCDVAPFVESYTAGSRSFVDYDDGAGNIWSGYVGNDGRIQSIDGTPPSQGWWTADDIVLNSVPSVGEPIGWIATATGVGAAANWVKFGITYS